MSELMACVRRANENAGNMKSVVQVLTSRIRFLGVYFQLQSMSGSDPSEKEIKDTCP